MADNMDTPEARFWAKVDRRGPDECWPWQAAIARSGHGHFRWNGKVLGAHRASFLFCRGPVASGAMVLHSCDNAGCCNPAHLSIGDNAENMAQRLARGRWNTRKGVRINPEWTPRPIQPHHDMRLSMQERIRSAVAVDNASCWIWQGAKFVSGYGRLRVNGKLVPVHRLAYEAFKGSIPVGLFVLHQCDVCSCCNPDHLSVGTHSQNMAEMRLRGRSARGAAFAQRPMPKGEEHYLAKLTEVAVREIRASTLSRKLMAEKWNVTEDTVKNVRTRRTWKHVE